jgi:hypothetical protein
VPGALQPSRLCRLPRLSGCGHKECCGSWLSVRLRYQSQQLAYRRDPARARRADPLTAAGLCMLPVGWPRGPRPISHCSPSAVGQLPGVRACRTTLAAAHFKLRSSGWCLVRPIAGLDHHRWAGRRAPGRRRWSQSWGWYRLEVTAEDDVHFAGLRGGCIQHSLDGTRKAGRPAGLLGSSQRGPSPEAGP